MLRKKQNTFTKLEKIKFDFVECIKGGDELLGQAPQGSYIYCVLLSDDFVHNVVFSVRELNCCFLGSC